MTLDVYALKARRARVTTTDGVTGYVTGVDVYPGAAFLRLTDHPRADAADFDPEHERWVRADEVAHVHD